MIYSKYFHILAFFAFPLAILAAGVNTDECPLWTGSALTFSDGASLATQQLTGQLFQACSSNTLTCFPKIFAEPTELDHGATSADGYNALFACAMQSPAVVRATVPSLLEHGADASAVFNGETVLMQLFKHNVDEDLSDVVVTAAAAEPAVDVNAHRDGGMDFYHGYTALHYAVKFSPINIAPLLAAGADRLSVAQGMTPLLVALGQSDTSIETVQALLAGLTEAEARTYVNTLVGENTFNDLENFSTVMLAVSSDSSAACINTVQALIDAGADVAHATAGHSALTLLDYGETDVAPMINLLVNALPADERLAFVRYSDAANEMRTSLHVAASLFGDYHETAISALLSHGALATAETAEGDTPLTMTCFFAKAGPAVRMLVESVPADERKAYLDHANNTGWSALLIAALNADHQPWSISSMLALLDLGADPLRQTPDGQTALQFVGNKHVDHRDALLAAALPVSTVTERATYANVANSSDGRTAIHRLATHKSLDDDLAAATQLVENWGADPCVLDNNLKAPADLTDLADVRTYLETMCTPCETSNEYRAGGLCKSAQSGSYAVHSVTAPYAAYFELPCPAGHTCAGGDAQPLDCPAGQYQPAQGQTSCPACPVGTTSGTVIDTPATGATTCTVRSGWHLVGGRDPTQTADVAKCPAGHTCAGGANTEIACVDGAYQPNEGQIMCLTCAAGSYTHIADGTPVTTAATHCKPCEAGHKCPGQGVRQDCEGKFYSHAGADACSECGVGHFVTKQDGLSTECTACSDGSYQPAQGQTSCLTCSDDQYRGELVAQDAQTCDYCPLAPAPQYSDGGACVACEFAKTDTFFCKRVADDQGTELFVPAACGEGYYRPRPTECRKCAADETCAGGGAAPEWGFTPTLDPSTKSGKINIAILASVLGLVTAAGLGVAVIVSRRHTKIKIQSSSNTEPTTLL